MKPAPPVTKSRFVSYSLLADADLMTWLLY